MKSMKTKNTKNKYHEAFSRLITFALSTEMGIRDYGDYYMSDWESDSDLIQELVKKETPMKPNHLENGYRQCGNCGMKLLSTNGTPFKYCSECGQRIDWSDFE